MSSTLQHYPIPKLGGGVNDYDTVYEMNESEMQDTSYNIRSYGDAYGPRPGYVTVFDTQTGGDEVGALGTYMRSSDSTDRLMMVYNNELWSIDPDTATTWTDLNIGAMMTSDATVQLISYRDDLFILNGVDKPVRYNGTNFTNDVTQPAELSAATFLPAFGQIFNEGFWVAGVPSKPNIVWVSKFATALNPEYIYDFSGGLASTGDAFKMIFDKRVTAIRVLPAGLVVFTINGAEFIPGFQDDGAGILIPERKPIDSVTGAVSQKSTVVVEQDIFYLTPEKEIRSVRRDFASDRSTLTTALSVKVQNYLDTKIDDDLSTAWAVYDPIKKLCKFHLKPLDGTINDRVLVFDMNRLDENGNPEIYIDKGKPFSCGVFFKKKLYVGSEVLGQVYEDEVGAADDDDATITTQRVSKFYSLGNPGFNKNMRNLFVEGQLRSPTEITVTVYVDEIIVDQQVITIDDVPDNTNVITGIGTKEIATYPIGSDAGDSDPSALLSFVKRLSFRVRGKNMTIVTTTDQVNQDWRIRQYTIGHISTPTTFYSVTER